jgi:hypothetical protein
MNPTRWAFGLAITVLVLSVFWDTGPDPHLEIARPNLTTTTASLPASTTTSSTSTTSIASTVPTTTTVALPLVFPDTPCQEWAVTAVQAGWPADPFVLHKLLTIMWRESRCRPDAVSRHQDSGLMQIHPASWCKPNKYYQVGYLQENGVISSCDELYDPLQNLRAARALFLYSEARGDAWRPWALTR